MFSKANKTSQNDHWKPNIKSLCYLENMLVAYINGSYKSFLFSI